MNSVFPTKTCNKLGTFCSHLKTLLFPSYTSFEYHLLTSYIKSKPCKQSTNQLKFQTQSNNHCLYLPLCCAWTQKPLVSTSMYGNQQYPALRKLNPLDKSMIGRWKHPKSFEFSLIQQLRAKTKRKPATVCFFFSKLLRWIHLITCNYMQHRLLTHNPCILHLNPMYYAYFQVESIHYSFDSC